MFVLLLITLLLIAYIYVKLKYFTLRGPLPGLSPHLFFGNLIQTGIIFNPANLTPVLLSFKRRFGNVFQFWLGPSRIIVVSGIYDVQYIFTNRHIYEHGDMYTDKFGIIFPDTLISIVGVTYKRHASLVRPIFRRAKIISHQEIIVDCVDKLLAKWRGSPSQKVHVDTVEHCQNLVIAIFGFIAFNYDLETLNDDIVTNNNKLAHAIRVVLGVTGTVVHLPNILGMIYLKLSSKYRRAQATIKQYCTQIIDHELTQSSELISHRKRSSFITSLVSSLQQDEKSEAMKNDEEKRGLSRNEMMQELIIFMVAGTDTTATTLAWFIYYMSKYPRVQQKIKAELADAHDDKRFLSCDHIELLVYLDAVIKELLRLSPPFDGTFRTLTVADCLPESGAQLCKGDQVYISFNTLSREPQHWSIDPELFYPERFLEEDKSHHPYAWIPFGGGHRQCMGQHLALFQLKVIIARLMQHVTFGDGGSQVNAGGHVAKFSISPKHLGVTITFD